MQETLGVQQSFCGAEQGIAADMCSHSSSHQIMQAGQRGTLLFLTLLLSIEPIVHDKKRCHSVYPSTLYPTLMHAGPM